MRSVSVPVLLVDDRPENLLSLAALLDEMDGLEIVQAHSGEEALRMLLEREFALVLMDVQMPGMDGFETATLMRVNPKTRRVPIVFVTALTEGNDFEFRGYESGAVDCLTKPIEPVILHAKVQVFADLYRQRLAMAEHERYMAHVEEQVANRTGQHAVKDDVLRVLLVDDRPENLTALQALLEEYDDLVFVQAHSGAEALRALLRQDFAVILMDVQMPGMDGYETVELIRGNLKTRLTPVIFVTAGMQGSDSSSYGYEQGAVDYLIKPLDPVIVRSKVRVFCDLYRQRLSIEKHNAYLEVLAADRTAALQRSTSDLRDSRESYRRTAEKLELATRAAGLGVWDWNVVSHELVWDARMYELYGVTPGKFERTYETWLACIHPDDRARCDEAVKKALRNEQPYSIEFRIRLPDGALRHIKGDGKVTFDTQGHALRMTGINVDISERKRAEDEVRGHRDHLLELVDERTASLNAIVDHAADGIITVDQYGTILSFNVAAERMFGYSADAVIGHSDSVLVPPPHCFLPEGMRSDNTEAGKAGESGLLGVGRELLGQRRDGSVFPLYLAVSETRVRGHRHFTGIARDISAQKALEARLIQAREVAEEANRSKSDFLANMSHEIRTPMNAIIGMTRLALQTELTQKQHNYLMNVDRSAQGLLGIINDILDFSKIEAGKLLFEHTDFLLGDVLEHVAAMFVPRARDKGLELLFDVHSNIPQALVGDPLRLRQVLTNLVSNAIKFTESGEVIVSIAKLGGGVDNAVLRFEVKDTGIGISPEQSARLFSAFVQADSSTTRNYGGSGLGLSISKRLVEMMEGQLSLKSEIGVGSRFIFTARMGLQATQWKVRRLNGPDLPDMRVLVVDDNPSARNIMVSIVESLQLQVGAVGNARAAINELEAANRSGQPYHVMFMDWDMPQMDGLEAVKQIRAADFGKDIVVIMVTAHNRDEVLERSRDLDLEGVLEKPINATLAFDAIARACGMATYPEERRRTHKITYEEACAQVQGARVLLVEDNKINQELALDILSSAGLIVDLAENGVEAVAKVSEHDYDAVLMDCQMPVMDGYEATRRIRRNACHAALPILAMTAHAMVGDREKCLAAGMNAHIPKPIDVAQLFKELALWIKSPGLRMLAAVPLAKPVEKPEKAVARDVAPAAPLRVAPPGEVPRFPGIDLDAALQRLLGNSTQYKRLLAMFHQGQGDAIERMRGAWDSGDRDSVQLLAHTLKGLAGYIGATALESAAETLETSIRNGQDALFDAQLERVAVPLRSLMQSLDAYLVEQ